MSTAANDSEKIEASEFFEPDSSDSASSSSSSSSSDSESSDSESESDSDEQVPIQEMEVKELRRQRKTIKGLNELSDEKLSGVLVGCTVEDLLEIDKLNGEGCFESSEAWNGAWEKAVHTRFTEGMIRTIRKQMESTHGVFSQDASTAQLVANSARRLNRAHLPLDDVLRTLRGLEPVEVTMEDLKRTKIGKVVNTIMKTSMDPDIKALSKDLVSKWRKVAAEARHPDSGGAAETPSTDAGDTSTNTRMCEWRSVYQFYKDKLQASRDRARKARETGFDAEAVKRQKRTAVNSSAPPGTVVNGFRLPQSQHINRLKKDNIVSKTRAKKRAQAHSTGPVNKKRSKRSSFTEDGMMVELAPPATFSLEPSCYPLDILDVSTASSSSNSSAFAAAGRSQLVTSCPLIRRPAPPLPAGSMRLTASAHIHRKSDGLVSDFDDESSTRKIREGFPSLNTGIPASCWLDHLTLDILMPPLSSGPLSSVSRGSLGPHGEAVVVKSSSTGSDDQILEEARVLLRLYHVNLVELRGVRHDAFGRVQALLHHIPLSRPLSFHLPLCPSPMDSRSRRRAASWAIQLLDAVEYLHWRLSPAVIHRDIKPENILVQQQQQQQQHHHHHSSVEVIKLVDFGLALEISQDGYAKPKPQFRGGTVRYMAPENHDFDGKLSRACDVWSCALVSPPTVPCGFQHLSRGPQRTLWWLKALSNV
ncbi:hypothetical protein FOZ61_007125 [Perkinsus olseni]|uniref:TFIIS N-terminal domain-containing protein n=1 Tax=Perkinsus olseni TaxID=32597 RepID=A0A7J6LAG0_PEROL|nr:hypothetical protein FOZ61_007125 [Perkinsus olseni]